MGTFLMKVTQRGTRASLPASHPARCELGTNGRLRKQRYSQKCRNQAIILSSLRDTSISSHFFSVISL